MSKQEFKYRPGELHAVQLDANTVVLVMPTDYAVAVRDVLTKIGGNRYSSRRKWTGMVHDALNGLKDFPGPDTKDMTHQELYFHDNAVVLP